MQNQKKSFLTAIFACGLLVSSLASGSSTTIDVTASPYNAVANNSSVDNTTAFQNALNASAAAGGGNVFVPVGRYWFSGVISIPSNVVLTGETAGPFDPLLSSGHDPSNTAIGASVLVLNLQSSNPSAFLTIGGSNSAVTNLLFFYPSPNQVVATAATPNPFQPTINITSTAAGTRVTGCSFTNSYIAIAIAGGRAELENLNIGAYSVGVFLDAVYDFVKIAHVMNHPYFDLWTGFSHPQNIDTWVFNNSYGVVSRRADGLALTDVSALGKYAGLSLQPSSYGTTFGTATELQFDSVQYGIISYATNPLLGFSVGSSYFTAMGAPGLQSAYALYLLGGYGGSNISLGGGAIESTGWLGTGVQVNAGGGTLKSAGVIGLADGTITH
jgi:hypothetical protein